MAPHGLDNGIPGAHRLYVLVASRVTTYDAEPTLACSIGTLSLGRWHVDMGCNRVAKEAL